LRRRPFTDADFESQQYETTFEWLKEATNAKVPPVASPRHPGHDTSNLGEGKTWKERSVKGDGKRNGERGLDPEVSGSSRVILAPKLAA
jgi:hypothetical protein